MSDTGWKFPGTMVGNRTIPSSDADWSNPDNAKVDDTSIAVVELTTDDDSSGLAASNFDFSSIPSTATIEGIEIRVGDYRTNFTNANSIWSICKLILADNSDGTENKSSDLPQPNASSLQTEEAGGALDVWGEVLTLADVQDIDFGFFIGAKQDGVGTIGFWIDFLQMRVFYNAGLPTTIVSDVGLAGHHSPFKSSGGAFYSVVRADADELDVYKATDPTDLWTIQGTGPVHAGTIEGFSSVQDGDVIHIVAWSSATYEYYTFNMATDAWVVDQLIETPTNAPSAGFAWASIAVRSDGDVVVVYSGDTDQNMGGTKERVDVNIRTGGTWGGPVALDAAGDIHYGNPNCVLGATSDRVHFGWSETTNTTDPPTTWASFQGRTLDPSDNSLSTAVGVAQDTAGALLGASNVVAYDDGTTIRMLFHGAQDDGDRQYWLTQEFGAGDDVAPKTQFGLP